MFHTLFWVGVTWIYPICKNSLNCTFKICILYIYHTRQVEKNPLIFNPISLPSTAPPSAPTHTPLTSNIAQVLWPIYIWAPLPQEVEYREGQPYISPNGYRVSGMQQHITQSQKRGWVSVELHFLIFGSEVGKSGTLKERGIDRDKTRYLQGHEK